MPTSASKDALAKASAERNKEGLKQLSGEKPTLKKKVKPLSKEATSFALDITKAYAVIGKAGYGKTTWIREYIANIPPELLWVFDFNGYDFAMLRDTEAALWINTTGQPEEAQNFIECAYAKKKTWPIEDSEKPYEGWTFAVMEEADNYLMKKLPGITRFVNTARNRAIGFIVSAKRAKNVPPIYRTRFDYVVVFHTTLPEDIEYVARWIGIWENKEETAKLDSLMRGLGKGEYIICDVNSGEILGPYKLTLKLPDHNKMKNIKPKGMTDKQAAQA